MGSCLPTLLHYSAIIQSLKQLSSQRRHRRENKCHTIDVTTWHFNDFAEIWKVQCFTGEIKRSYPWTEQYLCELYRGFEHYCTKIKHKMTLRDNKIHDTVLLRDFKMTQPGSINCTNTYFWRVRLSLRLPLELCVVLLTFDDINVTRMWSLELLLTTPCLADTSHWGKIKIWQMLLCPKMEREQWTYHLSWNASWPFHALN